MTKKLLLTFALLLTAVTGAWANEYLYFEISETSETSATMKYGENFGGNPYYDERADWWISDDSPWDGRENIKTITVDASCQNINQENLSGLFYGFTNLETITNIDKLNTANVLDMSRLFQGCSSLTTLDLSGWNTSEVTDMSSMFYGCTSLTTLNIIGWDTSNVTNTVSMFSGCTKLASISFPASLTTIGDFAFQGCTDLATVTFAAGSQLETIGEGAFNGTGLTSIEIPASVTGIGMNAFNGCYNLATVSFAAGSQLETIGESAFNGCSGLASITIPASVTTIGDFAFQGCTDLSSITLAEGLTTIGGYAFYNCGTTIESVTIPESVTSIGGNAFNGTNVTNFYINNIPSKIAIGETPFKADGVTIHVFTQMQSTFENATNWSAYTGHFNADIAISHVQSITLDNESMIMNTNTSGKLNATINPADARVKDVVFTSSNDNIIHITNAATGEFITGATEGNATITCTAMDGSGKYASCTVSVQRTFTPAESVTLNKLSMSVNVGNTFKLTATINPTNATYPTITWRSSDENVATVDNTGNVTAIVPGVATITAISHDGQARANCVVTVDASGSCGTGVTWTLTGTSPNYTLTITGTGAMADYNNYDDQPWYDYAENIKTIVIGNGVTSIGKNAFNGCYNLATVTFAAGSQLETIGESAFNGCSGLASITIPASLTGIGDGAFDGCSELATVTVYAPSCTLGSSAFDLCGNDLKIYVFSDLVDDYQAAWSTYAGKITAIPTVTTSYVDADGTLHDNVEAVPLNNAMTTLPSGTYVVNNDVTYTSTVTLSGDVTLILADGKTMSVTTTDNHECINADGHSLHIYGQTQGTGTLSAQIQGNADYVIHIEDGTLGIHGGNVNATVGSTETYTAIFLIRHNAGDAFIIDRGTVTANGNTGYGIQGYGGNYCINGGQVIATGASKGISVSTLISSYLGVLILSGGTITASSFYTASEAAGGKYAGSIKVADGHIYYDEDGNSYTAGTLTSEQITAIAGKTLRPVMGVVLTKDGSGNISAEFDGTSLETVSIPINITVNSVTLNRTFTLHKCATLMLPFSLGDGQSLNGGTLYKFDGVNNGEGDWVATLSEFTSPLKANTPYLIEPNGHMTDDKITFDLNGGSVTLNTTTAGEDSNEKDDLWDFIGTYSYIKWTSDTGDQDYSAEREAEIGKVYGFAAVEKTGIHVGDFVRVASGAKIRPMCAYLKWKGSIPNNARALTRAATNDDTELPQRITVKLVSASGETTAIGTLDTTTGEVSFDSEAWYTLDGVRLSGQPSTKGIYINNGKKIVIK